MTVALNNEGEYIKKLNKTPLSQSINKENVDDIITNVMDSVKNDANKLKKPKKSGFILDKDELN